MATADTIRQTGAFEIRRYVGGEYERAVDQVAVEEPLEIRIGYTFKATRRVESIALTMRTPGYERELTAGFLLAEGVIQGTCDVADVRLLGTGERNEVLAELAAHVDVEDWRLRRATIVSSACGLCGKRSKESIPAAPGAPEARVSFSPRLIESLPDRLRRGQAAFGQTGGLHAAGLVSSQGDLLSLFEDIGRHNALDKLIGACLLGGGLPLSDKLLFLSSRASFELVQKALAAGCPALATVGAPSSLAIELARERGLTLIGFVRDGRFNVYSGETRVAAR